MMNLKIFRVFGVVILGLILSPILGQAQTPTRVVRTLEDTWLGANEIPPAHGFRKIFEIFFSSEAKAPRLLFLPQGTLLQVRQSKEKEYYILEPWVDSQGLQVHQSYFEISKIQKIVPSSKSFPSIQNQHLVLPNPQPVLIQENDALDAIKFQFLNYEMKPSGSLQLKLSPPQIFKSQQRIWGFDFKQENQTWTFSFRSSPKLTGSQKLSGLKVLLDPGHHPDTGAQGKGGTEERNLTLLWARDLKILLERQGAQVSLSREENELPLTQRHQRFKEINPDLILSLHFNSLYPFAGKKRAWGTETYYYLPQAQRLAQKLHEQILPVIAGQDHGVIQRNFYVTRYPSVPTVLLEPTYMDEESQEKKLLDKDFRLKLGEAVVRGLINYFP